MKIKDYILSRSNIGQKYLPAVIQLLDSGATIPFIARYRKEMTGGMDEVEVSLVKGLMKKYSDLLSRKETILASIEEQGKLSSELKQKIENCWDSVTLEDIYLPYKKKRKTRADKARERGLEGLAKTIMGQRDQDVRYSARNFVKGEVGDVDAALLGARDIIAEWVAEHSKVRDMVRHGFGRYAVVSSKAKKVKDQKQRERANHFRDYWEYSSKLDRTPGHRLLAMWRGEDEGLLSVKIDIEADRVLERICRFYIKSSGECASQIEKAIYDSYKRLIKPSIASEFATKSKEKADIEAIEIFTKNLSQLLLEAPLGEYRVLALDPGFRSGCKVAVLDEQGDLLEHTIIYPHPPQSRTSEAVGITKKLIDHHRISAIAIGNGTAGRETEEFVKGLGIEGMEVYLISEAGASIYSASAIARAEFPDLDLTVRGAISIGRRLKDPLAELIKIDPKSIGVGQYQHDVDQTMLRESLEETVVSSVNKVGINLNTASASLLSHVSGLGPTLAKRIVDHRNKLHHFSDRKQLKEVKGLGPKAYEQAAGFLRVKEGSNPLDDSAVHPERYKLVSMMASEQGLEVTELIGNKKMLDAIDLSKYISPKVGMPTLKDIISELSKPGIDPRGEAKQFSFDPGLRTIDDLVLSSYVSGIIVNVAKFGAFVDIGIKENGLIHISQITDRFIKDPNDVLSVNQKVKAKVIGIDKERKRIQLSLL